MTDWQSTHSPNVVGVVNRSEGNKNLKKIDAALLVRWKISNHSHSCNPPQNKRFLIEKLVENHLYISDLVQ